MVTVWADVHDGRVPSRPQRHATTESPTTDVHAAAGPPGPAVVVPPPGRPTTATDHHHRPPPTTSRRDRGRQASRRCRPARGGA
ncbi:hypothetical protein FTX61_00550 [Nitriliruptoraceae bacterium ZYF776]|nr:hypothetical protein [Profundirhabdus halotolerans]